jgi:hypothetical protein
VRRTSIRQAAQAAIATAVDGAAVVEADSGYTVDTTPTIRVGWSEDAPGDDHWTGTSTVYVVGLLVEIYVARGPSALDAADDLQAITDAAVAGILADGSLGVTAVLPPTAAVVQSGGGEQNHLRLEVEYPVQYVRA